MQAYSGALLQQKKSINTMINVFDILQTSIVKIAMTFFVLLNP